MSAPSNVDVGSYSERGNTTSFLASYANRLRLAVLILVVGFSAVAWMHFEQQREKLAMQYPDPRQAAYRDTIVAGEAATSSQIEVGILVVGAVLWLCIPSGGKREG